MRIFTALTALFLVAMPLFATELSEYCQYPTGHENNPEFGDVNSHILLTISKHSDTELAITVAPREGSDVKIDYLYVEVAGLGVITVGEDEGAMLNEYTAIAAFTEAPEEVTIAQLQWSTPGWEGRWAIGGLIVPFDAVCNIDYNDDVKPEMVSAELASTATSSLTFNLAATDKDNAGVGTIVTEYLFTDAANGVTNSVVEINENGEATITGLKPNTTYNFTIAAMDRAGNVSDNTVSATGTTDELAEYYVISDFEEGTHVWEACEGSHELSVVENPYSGDANASKYVLQGGRNSDANFWAAAMHRNLNLAGGEYKYLHVMMYRNTIGSVPKAKLSDTYATEFEPISGQQTMVANEWQDVVFDISGTFTTGITIDFLYFMYDVGTLAENAVVYLDNVLLSNDMTPRVASSAIQEVTTNTSRAYGSNGTIYVKSETAEPIAVYSLTGSCVATSKAVERAEFALPSGCYLVKVGNKVSKVVL